MGVASFHWFAGWRCQMVMSAAGAVIDVRATDAMTLKQKTNGGNGLDFTWGFQSEAGDEWRTIRAIMIRLRLTRP
jgi:hypothetical protein